MASCDTLQCAWQVEASRFVGMRGRCGQLWQAAQLQILKQKVSSNSSLRKPYLLSKLNITAPEEFAYEMQLSCPSSYAMQAAAILSHSWVMHGSCRVRHRAVMEWIWFVNSRDNFFYSYLHGDKDTFQLAFHLAGQADAFQQVRH